MSKISIHLIIALFGLLAFRTAGASDRQYEFQFENAPLDKVLIHFSEETEIDLIFNPNMTRGKFITATYSGTVPLLFLKDVLTQHDLRYQRLPNDMYTIRHSLTQINPASIHDFELPPVTLRFSIYPENADAVFMNGNIISNENGQYTVVFPRPISRIVIVANGYVPEEILMQQTSDTTEVKLREIPPSPRQRLLEQMEEG